MTSAFLTLKKGQGYTTRSKVTKVSAFFGCFLFPCFRFMKNLGYHRLHLLRLFRHAEAHARRWPARLRVMLTLGVQLSLSMHSFATVHIELTLMFRARMHQCALN